MNKKAQFHNYMAIIIYIFIFGLASIFGYYFMDEFIDGFQDVGYANDTIGQQVAADFRSAGLLYDKLIVFVMVCLLIALGLTNYKLRTAPAFFIITIIEASVFAVTSYFFNHIFFQIVSTSTLYTITGLFPATMIICTNFHWIALAVLIIGSITLYAKQPSEEQDGYI